MDHRVPIVANKLKQILADKKAEEMAVEIIKALDGDGGVSEENPIGKKPPGGGGGQISSSTKSQDRSEEIRVLSKETEQEIRTNYPAVDWQLWVTLLKIIQEIFKSQQKVKS